MFQLSEIGGLWRFARGARRFVRDTLTPAQAAPLIRRRIADRQHTFLDKLNSSVFQHPRSPYLQLMKAAGCEFGDCQRLVRASGVEATLETLREQGVCIGWDEFKGRVPVRRAGREWLFSERDFDNPFAREHFRASSSGTSGRPVRTRMDLEDMDEATADWAVWFDAHGWIGRPLIFWETEGTGLASRYLKCARFGMPFRKWFISTRETKFEHRLRASVVHTIARRAARLPQPELASVAEAHRVAAFVRSLLDSGEKPLVNTSPSAAARLSSLVLEQGCRLDGVTFFLSGEPVTLARKRSIEASGACAVPTYGTSEAGWIGAQFPDAESPDEVHVFRDAYAVIARDGSSSDPSPLLFTSLRRAGPKVLLNTELGDSAFLLHGAAGAALDLGYTLRLHTIRSFRKITAWGMTLAVGDLYPLVEESLPRRFGGGFAHYQLVEDHDATGAASLRLIVSPHIRGATDDAIREYFFGELAKRRSYYAIMSSLLRQADALKIERRTPYAGPRGKVLPVVPRRAA